MNNISRKLFYIMIIYLLNQQSYAVQEFIIEDIRVEGLQRITSGTVFNYLSVKVGDSFNESSSVDIVRSLFETGFFEDIELKRDGGILVIELKERPAIGSITLSGNEDINSEDMIDSLKRIGFAEGRPFNRSQLEKLEQELQRQYNSRGKYAVELESTITDLGDNRVAVAIDISEGSAAKIRGINIVGNEAYEEDELLESFQLTEPTLTSFFSKKDQYSQQKLTADIESLRSKYLNAGYINFNIDSTQVSITPDKRSIYITINITEGDLFTVSKVKLTGSLTLPAEEFIGLIDIRAGDIFSRQKITRSSESLSKHLGDVGYAFANVNPIPEINNDDNTVEVTFFIDPGKRTYVRRINFSGNTRTRDEVLRREMRQQESSWFSSVKVDRGKVRLQRLGFFSDVSVAVVPVPGTSDQVDVNYSVTEAPSGNLSLGFGFSQTSGLIFRTSVAQENFLGSGKKIDFSFNNSDINRQFGIGYLNPYYTVDGISRSLKVFYQQTDSVDANIVVFDSTVGGAGIGFGIPVTEHNTFRTELSYENTEIDVPSNSSMLIRDFIEVNGDNFNILRWSSSFSLDTLNKAILPDDGTLHRLTTEFALPALLGDDVKFYKIGYKIQKFLPLFLEDYVLSLKADIGYGDSYGGSGDGLPFFENFYAGGPRSVRGYEENTLGPIDPSTNRPLGGNLRLVGGVEIILPLPFFKDIKSVRISSFIDSGNVYGQDEDFDIGELRHSVGLSAIWVSPFGLISASIAKPFLDEPGDQLQNFQFTFGTSF